MATATHAAGDAEESDALLVTDDVDFFENLKSEDIAKYIRVLPITSGALLIALNECGAITDEELEAVLVAEVARLDADSSMQTRKRALKEEALTRMAVRLGRRTAT
ncbi:hypothetical protein ACKUT9_14035 [Mycobacterium seoulense]|uniref:hypothetical protein n=1 Tax=Mycobacterium seoulense TaxID=386911 RepID=UPI003CFA1EBA